MYIFAYLAANPLSPPRRRICRVSNCLASPTNTLSNQLKQNKQKLYIWNKIVHSWTYVRLVNWFDCISNPLRLNPGGNYRFCWKHLTPLKIEAFSRGLNDDWGWKVTISIPVSLLTFTFTFYFLLLLLYPTPLENAVWAFSRERMMAGYEKLHFLWSTSCFFSPRRYIAKLLFRINRVNDAESFWNVESFKQIVLLWSDRQCSTCCMYLVQKVTIWTGCAKMVALNQPLD